MLFALSFSCTETMERTNPFDPEITMKTFLGKGYEILEVNNVFKLEDSPYYIDKNLMIKAKVTIEPGVEIKISPGVAIHVDGSVPNSEIHAIGRADAIINFSSSGNTNWAGIVMSHLQSSVSKFQYCRFENADYALDISDDSLNVENCHFENTNIFMNGFGYGNGVNGTEPMHPLIKNCTFMNSEILMTNGAEPWILYNDFSGGGYVISADHDSKPKIGFNKFGTNLPLQGAASFINSQPHIYNNTLVNALEHGLQFKGGNTATVEYNEFSAGEVHIYVRTTDDPAISVSPVNNDLTIENNNFQTASSYNVSLRIIGASGEAKQTSDVIA